MSQPSEQGLRRLCPLEHDLSSRTSEHLDETDRAASVSPEMAAGSGVERVLQRIRGQIEDGAYYEAQQSYKTIYHRYKAKDLIQQSHRVLEEGACLQLEKHQVNCGVELGNLLLQAYDETQTEVTEDRVRIFRKMVLLLPKPTSHVQLQPGSAEVEEGGRLLDNIIRFFKRRDSQHLWYREFNASAGAYLYDWEGWTALGRCLPEIEGLTIGLVECLENGNPSEEDLFVCRAVLQILRNIEHQPVTSAADFLQFYRDQRSVQPTPLLNFTAFLIEALQVPSEGLVEMLKVKYAPALSRDRHLEHLLKAVASKQFRRRSSNIFSQLLGGLSEAAT